MIRMITPRNPLFPLLLGFTVTVVRYGAFGDRHAAAVPPGWEQSAAVSWQREAAARASP